MKNKTAIRYYELDAWRGLAILGMVAMHVSIVEAILRGQALQRTVAMWGELPLTIIGRASAISFLLLVGISGAISYWRRLTSGQSQVQIEKYFLKRGLSILGLGMVITVVTWLLIPESYIRFGILHLIGTSVLFIPLLMSRSMRIIMILVLLAALWIAWQIGPVHQVLILAWQYPAGFQTQDIWPITPWMGVVVLGVELAHWLYPQGKRRSHWQISHQAVRNSAFLQSLVWSGQRSLWIYMLHVPVIVAILLILQQF
ncbi:MAG: heparan-alpha-glucosaminide N-acetyltransferase [Patescibacteria group bacterium]